MVKKLVKDFEDNWDDLRRRSREVMIVAAVHAERDTSFDWRKQKSRKKKKKQLQPLREHRPLWLRREMEGSAEAQSTKSCSLQTLSLTLLQESCADEDAGSGQASYEKSQRESCLPEEGVLELLEEEEGG